ncbi:MAG: alkaline phosphatase family protein [Candidatus Latescibacteria bacterium]|nr:alkaline phosphatase family protein [Candidatus Latescibacterota bacterium]
MLDASFIPPRHGERCFADLPATIKFALTGQGTTTLAPELVAAGPAPCQTVILFFIDAFGWRFFAPRAQRYPFLADIARRGQVATLTSQFPSTTAAHVTCIHTGQPVGQSGIFEWQYYEPGLDAMVAPLPYAPAGSRHADSLPEEAAQTIFPQGTFYRDLQQYGVESHVFQSRAFTPSTCSNTYLRGARAHPFNTLSEALTNLAALVQQPRPGPAYFLFYFDQIDAMGHRYGPDSPQIDAEIDSFLTAVERLFWQPLAGQLDNTLFLLTADHGLAAIDPETTIYLNDRTTCPQLASWLRSDRQGRPLVPAGSCRDFFLYIEDQHLNQACDLLQRQLQGRAQVCRTQDLIAAGLFGPQPLSDRFHDRIGNLVVLPYEGESVWWYEKDRFAVKSRGYHGGLTAAEMEIPLLSHRF